MDDRKLTLLEDYHVVLYCVVGIFFGMFFFIAGGWL